MIIKFVEAALRDIAEVQASIARTVVSGQAGGDRYHALTGEIRGLERAAQLLRDLIEPQLDTGHPLKDANGRKSR